MVNLKFADTHNMVAFLSKPEESDGFEKIVDFLNAHPIKYALTVNPTIYISCIEQFWSIVKAKTINGEVQLHVLVDGKKIIITESTVRRDLQLKDAEGVDCLPNSTIFEQLTLMGSKTTAWNEFSSTMASAIICLATNHKFNFSKYIFEKLGEGSSNPTDPQHTPTIIQSSTQPQNTEKPRKPKRKDTQVPQLSDPSDNVADEAVHKELGGRPRGNTLQSDEDRLKLDKLMALCTTLQNRVLNLEKTKTTQHNEIASLKKRVKKLKKKNRSRTHKLKRLYKVGLTSRVEYFGDEESLGEDESKQGSINTIDVDEEITIVSVQDDADKEMFDVDALNSDEVFVVGQNENVVEEVVDAAQVSTAATTVIITTEEFTLAQALEALKKFKTQEFDEEERLAREKVEKEKEANIALIEEWDDIQAKIDADHHVAERLQAQEQEELSVEEKATLFQQLLEKRRKHFAAKRAEEKRNKPPTKDQQRKIMCTYLKNMEGYKLKDLKLKEEVGVGRVGSKAKKERGKQTELIQERFAISYTNKKDVKEFGGTWEEPKKDERGIVIRNKARLVAQGYTQEEGIDYDEIEEEVYVCQNNHRFEDLNFPDRVYKVKKALYGLHQAPRAWFIEVKTASTPTETQKPLLKDEDGEEVDVHMYRSMIGSLMYLTSSRPDIMFAVSYTNSDIARASLDRKSTTGDEAVHKELGDNLVRAATTASSLEEEQDSGNINKTQSKATPNESSSQGTNLGGGPWCQETMGDTIAQTKF
ncbi:uncharacterized mitochondrial protein-like protein [Tanacetum coccineum]